MLEVAEDVASKALKNVFDYPTVVWRRLSRKPPQSSHIHENLTLPETRVIGLYLRRWKHRSNFIQIWNRVHDHSRSSKVINFGINRKRV